MRKGKTKKPQESEVLVRRGRVDSVDLYELTENELDKLENGEQADIFLNFAISLFSLTFSVMLTLISATFKKPIYEMLALIILVVSLITGIILIILWHRSRIGIKTIIKRIRDRIPPDVVKTEANSIVPDGEEEISTTTEPALLPK